MNPDRHLAVPFSAPFVKAIGWVSGNAVAAPVA